MAWADLARTANFVYTRGSDVGMPHDSLRSLALRATDKAAALAPNDPVVWLLKARIANMMDPTDDAPRLFGVKKALSLDSTYAPAWFELGIIREELLEPGAALAAYQHAASLNPTDPQTLSFIALHYLWNGDYATGMRWADSAVNLEPTYAFARDASGQLAFELGKLAESGRQHEAETRLTTGSEQANAYVMYARALGSLGRKDEARGYLDRAMKVLDPVHAKHDAAYLGTALASFHDTVGAVRVLKSYSPREDVHFQLHLKRDPGLRWIKGSRWESELLVPDPKKIP
jgi:tetratricopeptide (TPR) repeat protein